MNNTIMDNPIKFTTFDELLNDSKLTFIDISGESTRSYRFPGGDVIKINQPIALNVSRSGGHRLLDALGESHYIPKGWLQLSWCVKEGRANFVA
jgi:hypothetical protein